MSVRLGGKIRTSEQLIKLFIRKCKKEGIVKEYKDSLIFETKQQKRRRKKREGAARHRSNQQKDQNSISGTDDKRKIKR